MFLHRILLFNLKDCKQYIIEIAMSIHKQFHYDVIITMFDALLLSFVFSHLHAPPSNVHTQYIHPAGNKNSPQRKVVPKPQRCPQYIIAKREIA